ncbi:MAG: tyrosine-type recombinase/integrase [Candidatus Thiodiazotropha endolucinida]|uniref:Tyrosine-type recombinase/integrase n=1 Tax=Candidatus Thiodiazotropha taylori TaxID=2792791 RepID=A0A9E4NHM1_9GAMM|nr:tyrosine-type recombinase/integrase [Candidatus Thiodiazotropha taylori]MCW4235575.1 tyrosine-type recombinase/integrase [Candidatus Thiodiazotropha endolucinida]
MESSMARADSKPKPPPRGFTPKFLDSIKPASRRYELPDKACPGLRIRVTPAGTKTFAWYYKVGTTTKMLTLGVYPETSLKAARDALEKAKERHKEGEPAAPEADNPKTVSELAENFYSGRILPQRKRPEKVREILDRDILPVIGKRKLSVITTPVIASAVEKVVNRGATAHAGKVLAILKQMFRYAEGWGFMDRNPAYSLDRKDLGVREGIKDRYLTIDEIRAVWHAIEKAPRLSVEIRSGFKILLLTGVRTNELLKAKWEHVNLKDDIWFIPEENSKTTAWTVPLSPDVKDLFLELKEIAGKSPWVLPGRTKGPISDKATGRAMRRLFELKTQDQQGETVPLLPIPRCTPHDFRRTLRTHLDDLGIEPHIAEKCLNHSLGRIDKTYNKNTLLDKRRQALEKWAVFVDSIVHERDNVIRIVK